MLTSLEQAPTVAAAARLIADRYRRPQAEVERDLLALCTHLLERGLVELVNSASA
jgi:hypothetical protein